MVKVDIVDEYDTPLKGKSAFFKDFNQNNKTEIALLEQIPDIKRRIATVFSNANREWGEKQYEWAQWKRSQGQANRELTRRRADELRIRKELTQRKANESRASMMPGRRGRLSPLPLRHQPCLKGREERRRLLRHHHHATAEEYAAGRNPWCLLIRAFFRTR